MLILEWRRPDPIHSNICSLKYTNILYYAGSPLSVKERLQWNNRCPRTPGKVVPHLCVNYIRSPFSDNKKMIQICGKKDDKCGLQRIGLLLCVWVSGGVWSRHAAMQSYGYACIRRCAIGRRAVEAIGRHGLPQAYKR